MMQENAKNLLKNVSWNMAGGIGQKVVTPLFHLFIARLVLPEDYGDFAIAIAFMFFYDAIKDIGLTDAILAKRLDFDFSKQLTAVLICTSIAWYLCLFFINKIYQFYGCSPFKVVRELGLERRETVRSLSAVGV